MITSLFTGSRTTFFPRTNSSTVSQSQKAVRTLVTGLELVIVPEDKQEKLEQTKSKEEKWIPLDLEKQIFLQVKYGGTDPPITHFNLYRIQFDKVNQRMIIPKNLNLTPVPI